MDESQELQIAGVEQVCRQNSLHQTQFAANFKNKIG